MTVPEESSLLDLWGPVRLSLQSKDLRKSYTLPKLYYKYNFILFFFSFFGDHERKRCKSFIRDFVIPIQPSVYSLLKKPWLLDSC